MGNTAVFGIYPNRESLREGLELARGNGFRSADISVLFPENVGNKEFAHTKSSKAPEGATVGAGSGAIIGGTLGWLAGIGSLAIPGIGPFIAAGPIMGLLAGIGAGGAVGGILGGLIGMGVPEYEAKRYEGRLRKGGILVSIHCDNSDWVKKAKQILEETGAEDISTASERRADFAASERPQPRRVAYATESVQNRRTGDRTVGQVMTRDLATADVDTTLHAAAERMRANDIALLIVSSDDDVVGVVTEHEVLRAIDSGYDPKETTIRVALTQDYPYCFEYQHPGDAEKIMEDWRVKHMLVLDDDRRVVGVVSATELVAATRS